MSRELRPVLAVVTVATIVVLAVMGLRSGTTEIVVQPPVDLPPPGAVGPGGEPLAVVISAQTRQETSFFGIIRGDTHHILRVQFYAPPECAAVITNGAQWPLSTNDCPSRVPIEGVVSGTGTAPTGETIVAVDVETTQECFEAVALGDSWPPSRTECTDGA
jgi:hypothetical protein